MSELSYRELREWVRDDSKRRAMDGSEIDLTNWKNPYTRLKSGFYVELSVPVMKLAVKGGLRPNQLTGIYLASSCIALALVLTGDSIALLAALLIFLTNGSLDWADGALARSTGQESEIGARFDPMAGRVKQVAFVSAVSVICFQDTGHSLYLTLGIMSSFLLLILATIPLASETDQNASGLSSQRVTLYRRFPLSKFIIAFLFYDGRARYTDIVIVLILLLIYVNVQFLLIISVVWSLSFFAAAAYTVWKVANS